MGILALELNHIFLINQGQVLGQNQLKTGLVLLEEGGRKLQVPAENPIPHGYYPVLVI